MEAEIERLVATLPKGERVTATIWAPPDSRLPFIVHMVDRACIGKCFSFQNYEPPSQQFRVRGGFLQVANDAVRVVAEYAEGTK